MTPENTPISICRMRGKGWQVVVNGKILNAVADVSMRYQYPDILVGIRQVGSAPEYTEYRNPRLSVTP